MNRLTPAFWKNENGFVFEHPGAQGHKRRGPVIDDENGIGVCRHHLFNQLVERAGIKVISIHEVQPDRVERGVTGESLIDRICIDADRRLTPSREMLRQQRGHQAFANATLALQNHMHLFHVRTSFFHMPRSEARGSWLNFLLSGFALCCGFALCLVVLCWARADEFF